MTGTILQRIFSRSKLPQTDPSPSSQSPPTSQEQTTTDIDITRSRTSPSMPSITFSEPFRVKKEVVSGADSLHMQNGRKHSYASVREEWDTTQSFRTRNLSYGSIDSPKLSASRLGASSRSRYSFNVDDADYGDESALLDDSDALTVESPSESVSLFGDELDEPEPTVTLETLPDEILDMIFHRVQIDRTQESYLSPRVDLFSLLLSSKALHEAALRVLYRHVTISRSKTFHKLQTAVTNDPALGELIQILDFSHYSQMGYGRSKGQTTQTPYLTKETLLACLNTASNLQAFLVHEHIDDELDEKVLLRLFGISTLKAIDLCGCSSTSFVKSLTSVASELPARLPVQRLSLHECTTLKSRVFEELLPRLPQVTHLDLAHTMVTDEALWSIPTTARITHLNLERCTQVTGDGVARFLTQHPAVKDSIVCLNIGADASRYRLLSERDLNSILPALPMSLRSLNIGGARLNVTHVPALHELALHLEELGLRGADLSLSTDITKILGLIAPSERASEDEGKPTHNLRYLDLTNVKSVTQMSLLYSPINIRDNHSLPLEVIELGSDVLTEISKRSKNIKNPEWAVRELGRRGWYVRQPHSLPEGATLDDGQRAWKMGARWWGMRKIPMVEQEVGGMYGYFMFKRN